MLTEDWMMRQVDALARSIAYLVFQKESTGYVPAGAAEDAALDELHRRLLEKVNAGDIGGAEDLLFAESDPDDRRYLELAVDFYARLNDLTDANWRRRLRPGRAGGGPGGIWRAGSAYRCCSQRRSWNEGGIRSHRGDCHPRVQGRRGSDPRQDVCGRAQPHHAGAAGARGAPSACTPTRRAAKLCTFSPAQARPCMAAARSAWPRGTAITARRDTPTPWSTTGHRRWNSLRWCPSTDERNIGQGPADANASAGPCFVCRRAAIPRARRGTPL